MQLLKGKVALITGASKGIGREIARVFAEQGADVAFTYLSSIEKGQQLEQELKEYGGKVKGFRSDASQYEAAEQLMEAVLATFGRLDILVNNAGITKDGLLMRMSEEQWDEVMRINLKSVFNLTKAATKPMMKQKSGSIVNMTSVVGLKGNAGQANYAASKAGILGFTKPRYAYKTFRTHARLGNRKNNFLNVRPGRHDEKCRESVGCQKYSERKNI
ncbi:MAG: SDR family NAD(P)-dependent oxidoreductase [Cyclobacteriaceae bacterium]|nr:SDR family NAD(P)-dependent oxidoreductase [Cyclobacteriaceae bacterium]